MRTIAALAALGASAFAAYAQPAAAQQAAAIEPAIREAIVATKEMEDLRACARANAGAYALTKAAEEIMKSLRDIRAGGSTSPSAAQKAALDKQWTEYKTLGGTAASPEAVRPPAEPCKSLKDAAQIKAFDMSAAYRQCLAVRPNEVKLALLSKDVMRNRTYLQLLETDAARRPAQVPLDPERAREELAHDFREYRAAGGPATRVEDVKELANPCMPEIRRAPRGEKP